MKKFIAIIIPIVSIIIGTLFHFSTLDLKVNDIFIRTLPAVKENPKVVLVNIDDNAIDRIGTFPFTRDVYADSIQFLKELGAESVVFDLSFLDPSANNVDQEYLNEDLPEEIESSFDIINGTVSQIADYYSDGIPSSDIEGSLEAIVNASEEGKNGVYMAIGHVTRDMDQYLAQNLTFIENAYVTLTFGNEAEGADLDYLNSYIALDNIIDDGDTKTPVEDAVTPAIDILLKHAHSASFVNADPDEDGTFRRVHLLRKMNGRYFAQLIFKPVLEHYGNPQIIVNNQQIVLKDAKINNNETEDIVIPRAEDGSFLIRFFDREFDEYDNQISISDAYLCKKCEKLLVSMVKEMDESGFYNYWTGDSTPKDLYENAEYIKGELQAGNTEDFSYADYLNYKEQFINSIKLFLNGNYQGRIVSDYEDDEETVEYINDVFDTARYYYSEYMKMRNKVGSKVNGAMCILGTTATSTTDYGIIMYQEAYPRVGVHYCAASNILSGNFMDDAPWWISVIIAVALCFAYSLLAKNIKSTGKQILFGVASIIVSTGVLLVFFIVTRKYVATAIPVIALAADFIISTVYNLLSTSHEKRFITNAFSQCLSKDVVDDIVANPGSFKLGGQKVNMTAIFTDIQKFSGFSELLTAGQLVALLNYYLTRMSNIIMDERGTVDKYEGDAIVAFVGAPVKMEDHASRACAAAIKMKKAEVEMNKEIEAIAAAPKPEEMDQELYEAFTIMVQNKRRIFTRIGLNSGEMTAGYMGSDNKKNYTMMGNNVNLASRLEGVNKQYSTGGILMSEATRQMLGDRFLVRSLDRVQVVNVTTPIRLYELIDEKEETDENLNKYVIAWENSMQTFESGDYEKALAMFKKLCELRPSDNVAKYYVSLIEKFFIKGTYPTAKDDFGVEYNAENPEGMKPEWVGTKYEIKGTFKLLQK